MKKLAIGILSAILTIPTTLSAGAADDNWPAAPTPNWASQVGLVDVRLSQWLPCKVEWKSTTDCIESIKWSKLDGSASGESTFVPEPGFDPLTAVQVWDQADNPQGGKVDNYGHFVPHGYGHWVFPTGFKNSDGSTDFQAYAHVMNGSLQFTASALDMKTVNLPDDAIVEMTLRTKTFQPYVGWIMSTVKDPSVKVTADKIVIAGHPTNTPWANGADIRVCDSNNLKASSTTTTIAINLYYNRVGQGVASPGDLILGTNGWWCVNDLRFDQATQQMKIGIGNTHFDENGKVIEGWFDLKVKGSRARQWWGMDPEVAVGFVKVEVLYEDGTSVVATTQAKYDKTNDWISIQSQGFHFSSPAVQVSFKKVETTKPVAIADPIGAVGSPTGITNPVLPPIMIDPTKTKSVSVKVSGNLVLLAKNPGAWKAKIAKAGIVKFLPGGNKGTYVANPGFKPLKVGTTTVVLTDGKKSYNLKITVTN